MDEDETFRVVRDIDAKERGKVDAALPADAPRPVLDQSALYGLAGEIVRRLEPHTEADPVAILAQLLAFFGNAIGRGPFYLVEATKHHTNLFAVLVGETAKGRKGTSLDLVRSLFSGIDERPSVPDDRERATHPDTISDEDSYRSWEHLDRDGRCALDLAVKIQRVAVVRDDTQ